MAQVLITGAAGMLGRAMVSAAQAAGLDVAAATRAALDICDGRAVARAVGPGTRLIFNCAAYTSVDQAEADAASALAVNRDGVAQLAGAAQRVGAKLVHFSTDYVFDGRGSMPYPTDSPRAPINVYGRSKAEGELALEASGCRYLLIRSSWVYAPWGRNFVRTMARLVAHESRLDVVDDQRGRPTSAEWLAQAALLLDDAGCDGTYHVTDDGECTWHDLARHIATLLGARCEVRPCTTADFPRPAARPAYSVLALDRTRRALGDLPGYRENVASVLRRLE